MLLCIYAFFCHLLFSDKLCASLLQALCSVYINIIKLSEHSIFLECRILSTEGLHSYKIKIKIHLIRLVCLRN